MGLRRDRREQSPSWTCGAGGHTITTEHLTLRTLGARDIEAVLATLDEEVIRWQGFFPDADARRRDTTIELGDGVIPFPYHEWLGIFDRATGTLIGVRTINQVAATRLGRRPPRVAPARETRAFMIGSWLGPGWRSRGLGTEELRALLQFMHNHLGVALIVSGTEETNVAALRQHRAAGFETYSMSDYSLRDGRTVPAVWMQHVQRKAKGRCALRGPATRVYVESVREILAVARRIAATFGHEEVGSEDVALACVHQEVRDKISRDLPTFTALAASLGWKVVADPDVDLPRRLTLEVDLLVSELTRAKALARTLPVDGTDFYDALAASDTAGGRLLRSVG